MNKNLRIIGRRTGSALVIVLCFIFLLSGLVVAVLVGTQLDRNSTQNYYQTARVQELAAGASEEILSDLKDEIAAGSREDDANSSFIVNGKRIFVPSVPADPAKPLLAMQPARIGFATGTGGDYATDVDTNNDKVPPSLVRVSRYLADQDSVFPDTHYIKAKRPTQRVSAVSSASRSANGRTISPKRWGSTCLLSSTPATPPTRFTNNPPQWVYYSRKGSQVYTDTDVPGLITASKDLNSQTAILGRYAYVIYDEGGLLDINSAGYPSTLATDDTTNGSGAIRGKSSIVYAALTSLAPLASKKDELDKFISWRSNGSAPAVSNFVVAAENWLKTGFLTVKKGDNPLLSRRDLIDYFTKKVGAPTALPYLGTFTRSLSAPTMRPATPVDSVVDYDKNADTTTNTPTAAVANRDLANVRFAKDDTITHYADDATSKTYKVKNGDQLLQGRFSLARLDWLKDGDPSTGNGPTGMKTNAIKACFGLVWDYPGGSGPSARINGGNKCWNYVGANGNINSIPQSGITIKTLAEVSNEGREPDFFELLKAAILSGSLGRYVGPACFDNGRVDNVSDASYLPAAVWTGAHYYNYFSDAHKFGVMGYYSHTFGSGQTQTPSTNLPPNKVSAQVPDVQIMRVGANIIDQYDIDSYPTAIYFKYASVDTYDPVVTNTLNFGPVTMVYGTENLPYLQAMRAIACYPDPAVQQLGGWRQPMLWNPHQAPDRPFQNRPAKYEIHAFGSGDLYWERAAQYTPPASSGASPYLSGISHIVNYFNVPGIEGPQDAARGTITFSLADSNSQSAFCFYDKPYPLVQDGLPNVTASSPFAGNLAMPTMPHYGDPMSTYNMPNHFVAFSTGATDINSLDPNYHSIYDPGTPNPGLSTNMRGANGGVNTYVLGWVDGSGGFHPYSFFTGTFAYSDYRMSGSESYNHTGTVMPYADSCEAWLNPDPRTERITHFIGINAGFNDTLSVYRQNGAGWYPCGRSILMDAAGTSAEYTTKGTFAGQGYNGTPYDYSYCWGDLMVNWPSDPPSVTPAVTSKINYNAANHVTGYYRDMDRIVRPGDGYYGNPSTGDGLMTFFTPGTPTGTPNSTGDSTANVSLHGRRPVIINRPFRSVGELGYVFRDQPFKTLDMFTAQSADTALLDIFSLADCTVVLADHLQPLTAGKTNLNAASSSVLKALLQGGAKKEFDSTYNINTESQAIADAIVKLTVGSNTAYTPIDGYRGLAPALVTAMRTAASSSTDKSNKTYLEGPLRALADSTDFRTWNLMVDLIVQSGQFSQGAQKLGEFTVQGEHRVWLHVAIDRYTGEVTARQAEPVYE